MKTGSVYNRCCVLSRDAIKLFAMLTMTLNHAAHMFVPYGGLRDVLIYAGYFTAPVMCYFLVEGFDKTRDRRTYFLRLLACAFLSQPFYDAALDLDNLNMLFTLSTCFLILCVMERVRDGIFRSLAVLPLVLLTVFMDWPVVAVAFTVILYYGRRYGHVGIAYLGCYAFYAWYMGSPVMMGFGMRYGLVSGLGILVAGFCVAFLYSGRRMQVSDKMRSFLQAFFYVFYPAHLAGLILVRLILNAAA